MVQTSNTPVDNKKDTFWDSYSKAMLTGMVVGPLSTTMVFPIDKIGFHYQTLRTHVPLTFWQALKGAFIHPLSGYFPSMFNAATKNVILFPLKVGFEKKLEVINPGSVHNSQWAGFLAGMLTVYLTAPVSLFKAWRFNGIPVNAFIAAVSKPQAGDINGKKIPHLGFSDMFRGVNATAFRDGVQYGFYFAIFNILNDMIHNSIVAGMAAGGVGSFCSNPLSVIAINQKIANSNPLSVDEINQKIAYKNKDIFETGAELYQEGGVKRFYRGYFTTTLGRMTIQGAAIGGAISIAEKIHASYNKKFDI